MTLSNEQRNYMEEILKLYPDYCRVYGPYERADGRKHIVLVSENSKNKKTLSYPKAILEIHLNRTLVGNETVDHKDEDFNNNDISNLRVLSRKKNSKRSAKIRNVVMCICPICSVEFSASVDQINQQGRDNISEKNKAGPFCSKKCVGVYGSGIRSGKLTKLKRNDVEVTFYKESEKEIN